MSAGFEGGFMKKLSQSIFLSAAALCLAFLPDGEARAAQGFMPANSQAMQGAANSNKASALINPHNPKKPVIIGSGKKIIYKEETKNWKRVGFFKRNLTSEPGAPFTSYMTLWRNKKYGYFIETPNAKCKGGLQAGVSLTPRRFLGNLSKIQFVPSKPDFNKGAPRADMGSVWNKIMEKVGIFGASGASWHAKGSYQVFVNTGKDSPYTGTITVWESNDGTVTTETPNVKQPGWTGGDVGLPMYPDTNPDTDYDDQGNYVGEGNGIYGENAPGGGGGNGQNEQPYAPEQQGSDEGGYCYYSGTDEDNGGGYGNSGGGNGGGGDNGGGNSGGGGGGGGGGDGSGGAGGGGSGNENGGNNDGGEGNGQGDDGSSSGDDDGDGCVGDDCGGEEGYIDTGDPCFFCGVAKKNPASEVERTKQQQAGDPYQPDLGQNKMHLDPKDPGGPVMQPGLQNAKPDMGSDKAHLDPKDPGGPVMSNSQTNQPSMGQDKARLDPKDPGGPVMSGVKTNNAGSGLNLFMNQMKQLFNAKP